jgi:ribonuclease-3
MTLVEQAAELLGYHFREERLLVEAITHASIATVRSDSNERMEFLGDAILGFVVCEYLYQQFPDLQEGEMTKIKSAVVSRRVCALISNHLGLADMLNLGKGMAGRPTLPQSIAAAALESIIAAMYLDGGIEPTRAFILTQMKPHIHETAENAHQHNFKSVLQQHAQRFMAGHPNYILLDEKGPDHAKCFEVCVEIDGRRFSSAWAQSKKQAEQQAALLALQDLGIVTCTDDGQVNMSPVEE